MVNKLLMQLNDKLLYLQIILLQYKKLKEKFSYFY